jgi:amino acid adenylation domain-containing protein
MFITLLAAFKALLHRYTGQDDLVVGTPVANRNHLEIEGMMGTFVNTLVIRSDVSGDPTFVEHVKRVREVVLGAFVHQDMPFEKLVEELQPERDTTRPPLVQVLFNVPNAPLHGIKFNGLQWSPVEVDRKSAQFDLSLSVDTELTHSVFLEYNTDLFEAESMKRLLGHFRNILEAIANDPECRISRLSVLSEQERAQILREWNSTDTEYRADSSIHDLFEHQSHSTPDAIALSFEGKNVSYSELDARSNQLAHVLLKKGVGPGVRVAVYMNRSIELVVALLGILKAGGAYVPIDSGQPIRRVAFYLADSGAQIVVTQSDLVKTLPANHAVSVIVDGNRSEIASESREKPRSSVTSRDIAYVIYTSGSTGEPKGVEIEHRSVVNFLASMQSLPGISASDVLLSVTTPSFDIAGLEIYLPLVTGARIVIAGEEDARDGRRLIDLLQKTSATMMQATPSTWEMLVNVGWKGNPQLKILCGGEPLSRRLADALLERGSSVWNMYGPTETTIWSSVARVMPGVNPIDIGKPIANTELYVLDGHMQPLPVGIPGELYIGGDGLARGYLNRPELTAAKFIPHPFSAKEGARLYRTGDRAKFLASGSVLCLGRTDDQVKVRGHRIEPGEIESAICRLPMVSRACVVSAAGSTGDSRLVAYVVLANEGVLSSTQLRENLAQILPDYMLPADVVFLRHLPLTPSGKVDKKKLPLPEELVDNVTDGYVAPRDPLELQLVGVWEEVLGRRRIGIRDNFFDLGGHSLISARLFPMVERRTGKALPWATLFEAPTIEKFAAVLRQEGWNPSWSSLVAIQPGGSKPPFYVVHGADGEVIEYLGLARFFGKEQPLYALQAQGLDGKKPRHATIEEMANHYITEIRTLQPRGPYFLGGACVGGYLALEMAQQLLAQGEGVGLLALIDSYAPGYPKLNPEVGRLVRILSRLKYRGGMHWRNIRVLKGAERWFYIKFWSAEYRRAAIAKLKMIRKKAGVTEVRKSNASPYSLYVPKPYPDKLWVFAASEHPSAEIADPCHGWSDFAVAGVEVHEIPGHDGAIRFEPSVRILAQKILHCLSEAQEKTTVSAERSVMPENPVRPSDATS